MEYTNTNLIKCVHSHSSRRPFFPFLISFLSMNDICDAIKWFMCLDLLVQWSFFDWISIIIIIIIIRNGFDLNRFRILLCTNNLPLMKSNKNFKQIKKCIDIRHADIVLLTFDRVLIIDNNNHFFPFDCLL